MSNLKTTFATHPTISRRCFVLDSVIFATGLTIGTILGYLEANGGKPEKIEINQTTFVGNVEITVSGTGDIGKGTGGT